MIGIRKGAPFLLLCPASLCNAVPFSRKSSVSLATGIASIRRLGLNGTELEFRSESLDQTLYSQTFPISEGSFAILQKSDYNALILADTKAGTIRQTGIPPAPGYAPRPRPRSLLLDDKDDWLLWSEKRDPVTFLAISKLILSQGLSKKSPRVRQIPISVRNCYTSHQAALLRMDDFLAIPVVCGEALHVIGVSELHGEVEKVKFSRLAISALPSLAHSTAMATDAVRGHVYLARSDQSVVCEVVRLIFGRQSGGKPPTLISSDTVFDCSPDAESIHITGLAASDGILFISSFSPGGKFPLISTSITAVTVPSPGSSKLSRRLNMNDAVHILTANASDIHVSPAFSPGPLQVRCDGDDLYLYWLDLYTGRVSSLPLSLPDDAEENSRLAGLSVGRVNPEEDLACEALAPGSIAVMRLAKKEGGETLKEVSAAIVVYFTDIGTQAIHNLTLDPHSIPRGKLSQKMVATAGAPFAVCVDPERGLLFWTENGHRSQVTIFSLGSQQVLANLSQLRDHETLVPQYRGLAYSARDGRLYVADANVKRPRIVSFRIPSYISSQEVGRVEMVFPSEQPPVSPGLLALDAQGRVLYVADAHTPIIYAIFFDARHSESKTTSTTQRPGHNLPDLEPPFESSLIGRVDRHESRASTQQHTLIARPSEEVQVIERAASAPRRNLVARDGPAMRIFYSQAQDAVTGPFGAMWFADGYLSWLESVPIGRGKHKTFIVQKRAAFSPSSISPHSTDFVRRIPDSGIVEEGSIIAAYPYEIYGEGPYSNLWPVIGAASGGLALMGVVMVLVLKRRRAPKYIKLDECVQPVASTASHDAVTLEIERKGLLR